MEHSLLKTIAQLRAPGGCPWDRKQTHASLRPYIIEEAYELLDVLDEEAQGRRNDEALQEELGDVLMQVLLHAAIAEEEGRFSFLDIARTLNEKLIRRHPHVFGELKATNADEVGEIWEKQKKAEKKTTLATSLSGVPRHLPALLRAGRMLEKTAHAGYMPPSDSLMKIEEELGEVRAELAQNNHAGLTHEIGDLLFSVCNLAHAVKVPPEDALRQTLARFHKRMTHIERVKDQQNAWEIWKKIEKLTIWGITGPIASGKSHFSSWLTRDGYQVLRADSIGHDLLAQPEQQDFLMQHFGTQDRSILRERIAHDPQARSLLESWMHPRIYTETTRRLAELTGVVFYESALLPYVPDLLPFAGIILMTATPEIRKKRLIARDGSASQALFDAQPSSEAYARIAHTTIDTSAELQESHYKAFLDSCIVSRLQ